MRAGHVAIFPLVKAQHTKGIQLSLLVVTPPTGSNPILVYNFSWSGFNAKVQKAALKEAMRFGISLHRLLN